MSTLFTILMALGCMDSPTEPHNALTSTGSNTPGQVIDLVVTDSTGTTTTLSFTQVDDGTGNPAAYAVRSHVGPMNWGAAEEVSQGTCVAPLQGNTIGSTMSCTVEGLSPDVAYTFQVAAFRGTFQAGAVYGELSNIVPDMEDEQSPNDASRPNEPGGYDVIARSGFPCVPYLEGYCADSGEWDARDSNLSTVTDGGSVLRTTFPAGLQGGSGPGRLDTWNSISSPTMMNEFYQSMHIRLASGSDDGLYEFYSGINKMSFWGYQGSVPSDIFVSCNPDTQGAGTGQVEDHCNLQMIQQNNVYRNIGTGTEMHVGSWYHWEFQFILNDVGSSNGVFRWWVDGVLIKEVTNMVYLTPDLNGHQGFYMYRWNPTWGGGRGHDDRKRTDYIDIENLYISGVPK